MEAGVTENKRSELKRFALKLGLFVAPLLAAVFIQHCVLPIDYFCFRTWEALQPLKFKAFLPGPFYPNQRVHKIEEGDLGHHTRFAVKKDVLWETDRYGYRNCDTPDGFPIVIVGDSNTAGSSLSQPDILPEVLSARLGKPVYGMASSTMHEFLEQQRFIDSPPEILILQSIEGRTVEARHPQVPKTFVKPFTTQPLIVSAIVHADRLYKMPMLLNARARFREQLNGFVDQNLFGKQAVEILPYKGILANDESMVFIERVVMLRDAESVANVIVAYEKVLRARNIRFIYMPIPGKANVYHEKRGFPPPTYLSELMEFVRKEGGEVVDVQSAFYRDRDSHGKLLFHTDDTHWSAHGVRVAVEALMPHLQKPAK